MPAAPAAPPPPELHQPWGARLPTPTPRPKAPNIYENFLLPCTNPLEEMCQATLAESGAAAPRGFTLVQLSRPAVVPHNRTWVR